MSTATNAAAAPVAFASADHAWAVACNICGDVADPLDRAFEPAVVRKPAAP